MTNARQRHLACLARSLVPRRDEHIPRDISGRLDVICEGGMPGIKEREGEDEEEEEE